MTNRIARLLLIFLLAGWQGAWAESAQPAVAEPGAAEAETLRQMQAAPSRGLLFAISKNGQAGYLFGTLHVGKADFYPLDLLATQAIARSGELVLELDASQADAMQAGVQRYAMLPPPQTLDALLSPELRQRLHARLDALGIPPASVQTLKPWMATLALTVGALKQQGYGFEYATEFYFTGIAQALGKPVTELEGIDYQFQLFDSLSLLDQLVYLEESLSYLEQPGMRADTQALIGAWLASDAAALQQITLESYQHAPRSAHWVKQKLFSERNQRMAAKIEQMLGEGRTPFVAVGALHLTGADGLPALLEKRGYRVTNLYP
ncbi:MAG: hypothetical protein B7Z35_05535 [Hydrogenophilales bacterium 12-61-10]|nr:MAG: hypothetical protein B7Z35_05535 [Hydrogenophilales bacterium 12-61-10]OYX32833.1 MAG: hypothetical protein B7Z03_01195 [Hydrogenophilales bacterium 32-62-9]